MKYDINKPCPHCGGDPKIANPWGTCSHIHYPEAVNKTLRFDGTSPALAARRDSHALSKETHTKDINMLVRLFCRRKRPLTAYDVVRLSGMHLLTVRPYLSRLSRHDECREYFGFNAPLKQAGRKAVPQSHVAVTTYLIRRRSK